jgi:uncharacterized protein
VIRVTADSNIYISAFLFRGTPQQLLQTAVRGQIDLAISDHIDGEVTRILAEKFDWPKVRIVNARLLIARITRQVVPSQTVDTIKEDPADNRILECANEAGSDYIVTGDNDLHRLGQYRGVRVVGIAEMLDLVKGPGWRSQ